MLQLQNRCSLHFGWHSNLAKIKTHFVCREPAFKLTHQELPVPPPPLRPCREFTMLLSYCLSMWVHVWACDVNLLHFLTPNVFALFVCLSGRMSVCCPICPLLDRAAPQWGFICFSVTHTSFAFVNSKRINQHYAIMTLSQINNPFKITHAHTHTSALKGQTLLILIHQSDWSVTCFTNFYSLLWVHISGVTSRVTAWTDLPIQIINDASSLWLPKCFKNNKPPALILGDSALYNLTAVVRRIDKCDWWSDAGACCLHGSQPFALFPLSVIFESLKVSNTLSNLHFSS